MAKVKAISKKQLNTIMKTLPKPVIEHSARCKKLAKFIVQKIDMQDWFMESGLTEDNICSAVYYHDIGKTKVPKDTLYLQHCKQKDKKESYYSHIDKGISVIESTLAVNFQNYKENSFENLLFYAITEHHEKMNGKGYKGTAGDLLCFTGKLTAVVDAFDNFLFVGKAGETDLDSAVEYIRQETESGSLDKEITDILLSDIELLRDFTSYINEREISNHKRDIYGQQPRFSAVVNAFNDEVMAYKVEFVINDPFYGIVTPGLYFAVADKIRKASIMQKYSLEKLCVFLENIYYKALLVPDVIISVSASNFLKKKFIKDITKIINKYRVDHSKLTFVIREQEAESIRENLHDVINAMHEEGYKIGIDFFRDQISLLDSDNITFDLVMFDPEYGYKLGQNEKTVSVVSGMAKIIHQLGIQSVLTEINNEKAHGIQQQMGVTYSTGRLHDYFITYRQLLTRLGEDNE